MVFWLFSPFIKNMTFINEYSLNIPYEVCRLKQFYPIWIWKQGFRVTVNYSEFAIHYTLNTTVTEIVTHIATDTANHVNFTCWYTSKTYKLKKMSQIVIPNSFKCIVIRYLPMYHMYESHAVSVSNIQTLGQYTGFEHIQVINK